MKKMLALLVVAVLMLNNAQIVNIQALANSSNTTRYTTPSDSTNTTPSDATTDSDYAKQPEYTTLTPSNSTYELKEADGYINVAGLNTIVTESVQHLSFSDSMKTLDPLLTDTAPGAGRTAIYFDPENPQDRADNILKVDLDFAGKPLPQPLNLMFIMDQSGSMNMGATQSGGIANTSPCMHDNHYYRVTATINGDKYYYYHSPQESKMTVAWTDAALVATMAAEAKAEATKQGIEVTSISITKYTSALVNSPNYNHYHINDETAKETVQRIYPADAAGAVLEAENFTKLDVRSSPTTDSNSYYSPSDFDETGFANSDEYIEYLHSNNQCYDRMLISKILFEDLSNAALEGVNNKNTIGYARFAGEIYGSRGLQPLAFNNAEFTDTIGRLLTNYSLGLSEAQSLLKADTTPAGQNLVIFTTDGVPTAGDTTVQTVTTAVQNFVNETNAIMHFAGIDLKPDTAKEWGPVLSTKDSQGNSLSKNGNSLTELIDIYNYLEKIITSATEFSAQVGDLFTLAFDGAHPIEITWRTADNPNVDNTQLIYTQDQATEFGISYDATTGTLTWDLQEKGITHGRVSFYKEIDQSKVDWDLINSGGTQEGETLHEPAVEFVDYTGAVVEYPMDTTAKATLVGNSKLTITNSTSTPYNVETGGVIDYEIVVKNTGNIDAYNLVVMQDIPENTVFHSTDGSYNAARDDITFTIPFLAAGDSMNMLYSVKTTTDNTYINSSAQLGVSTESTTLDAAGWPILSAELLQHKTPEAAPDPTPDPEPTPDPNPDPDRPTYDDEDEEVYDIDIVIVGNGTVTPDGGYNSSLMVDEGDDKKFYFKPGVGQTIVELYIDGERVDITDDYTFFNVRKDHVIKIVFSSAHTNPSTGIR